ncbi:unnamed protein product [Caenorhabditis auriculariae]|uniref:Uncharacterized protein n=1 Tax=Caenorhabditis auriculariae TaxID=2777116 RepID=A0A8S1HWN0_9PELO|nr:unnamed protein product [Caenorhabditis auriculariae]
MLGMMNSPSDSVEFYATNRKNSSGSESEDRVFTEIKQRDVITYTEDGRKFINGKLVTSPDGPSMWGEALMRGIVTNHVLEKKRRASSKKSSKKGPSSSKKSEDLPSQPTPSDSSSTSSAEASKVENPRIYITEIPIFASDEPIANA